MIIVLILAWIIHFWVVGNSDCLPLQCIFLVWCMAPSAYNGSQILYFRFIRPFILRYEKKIDSALDRATEAAKEGRYLSCDLECPPLMCPWFMSL